MRPGSSAHSEAMTDTTTDLAHIPELDSAGVHAALLGIRNYDGSRLLYADRWPRFSFDRRLKKALADIPKSERGYQEHLARKKFAEAMAIFDAEHPNCAGVGHDLRVAPSGKVICVRPQPAPVPEVDPTDAAFANHLEAQRKETA